MTDRAGLRGKKQRTQPRTQKGGCPGKDLSGFYDGCLAQRVSEMVARKWGHGGVRDGWMLENKSLRGL